MADSSSTSSILTLCFLPADWSFSVSSCAPIGQMLAKLQFSVPQLSEEDTSVRFDLQIVRYAPSSVSVLHCSVSIKGSTLC